MRVPEQFDGLIKRYNAGDFLMSAVLAILPAFGLYFLASYVADNAVVLVFWGAIIGFTALLLPKGGWRARTGASLFYIAIEAFLFPLGVLIVAVGIVSETTGTFAQLGAGIGAGIFFITTWLVSWIIGVVLYLISGRFESD